VLADGSFVTATRKCTLIFSGRCAAAGELRVVTSFTFRMHPVDTVYGGPIF